MKSKTTNWIKNSNNYEEIKELFFKLEMGEFLEETEKLKIIKIYNILKYQEKYQELIRKIRIYLYLYYDIDILIFEYIVDEGIFPILNSFFLRNNGKKEERGNFKKIVYETVVEQYKNDNKILTFEQDQFVNNVLCRTGVIYSAPTSFGKSTAIISKIKENKDKKTLIIVPSKMLIFQFTNQIIENFQEIPIIHPEQEMKKSNIYILTQERVQTLLASDKDMKFDLIFVDEAHHMLEKDDRSMRLITIIFNLLNRNPEVDINYFTPFKTEFKYNTTEKYKGLCVPLNEVEQVDFDEKIKIKRYFIVENGKYFLYNETLDELKELPSYNPIKGNRIIYLNKGIDILNYIEESEKDIKINYEIGDLENLLGKGIELFKGIEKGLYPIFGIIPYNIRNFMLEEFIQGDNGFLVVNSAALEGINTNAKSISILDPRKGKKDLKSYELENLIGRANRLSEVINEKDRMVTDVYFCISKYTTKNKSNVKSLQKYLKKSLKKNIVQNESEIQESDISQEQEIIIDNQIEEEFENKKELKTPVGKLLAYNNFCGINLETEEEKIQQRIDCLEKIIDVDASVIVNLLIETFLIGIDYDTNERKNIQRFEEEKTRKYYAIVFNYFINNNSSKEIIDKTVSYWKRKIKNKELDLVYVGTFGNVTRGGHKKHWVNIIDAKDSELYKYATIKTFMEVDFVELIILPFLKILYELGKIELKIYNKIMYSTDVPEEVELKKMGVSNELFEELKKHIDIKKIFDSSYKNHLISVKDKITNRIIKKEFEMIFDI